MKNGFTLVELSIVLVIIGLLIGGILVAQSMISTVKMQTMVRQVQQFDIAAANFATNYRTPPGDSKFFNPQGNGDGVVWDADDRPERFNGEIANYWVHLAQAGMKMPEGIKSFTSDISDGFKNKGDIVNAPTASYGENIAVVGFSRYDMHLYYHFQDQSEMDTGYPFFQNAFSGKYGFVVQEVMAVDNKIDDGRPESGNVFLPQILNGEYTPCGSQYSDGYITSFTERECTLQIKALAVN